MSVKKKIKDLTLEEYRKICEKNECYDCPLIYGFLSIKCVVMTPLSQFINEYLEKEIEVDEKEN